MHLYIKMGTTTCRKFAVVLDYLLHLCKPAIYHSKHQRWSHLGVCIRLITRLDCLVFGQQFMMSRSVKL